MDLKSAALSWLAKQFVGVNDAALSVVNRFRKAVDGKALGEPWCVCFVQYLVGEIDGLFIALNLPAAAKHQLEPTESSQVLWAKAKRTSQEAAVGAVAVWRSKANPLKGHVGIVIATGPDGIMTIEGNTSEPGTVGDEANGRGVWKKARFGGQIPGFDLLGYVLPWP